MTAGLGRRDLLRAAGGIVAGAAPPALPDWLGALSRRVDALGGYGLVQSYEVVPAGVSGHNDFDRAHANCAYVYDNAVAGMALLLHGDLARAQAIGRALAHAQNTDRFFKDGRLRNAYHAGPSPPAGFYPLPGWWDAAQGRWLEDPYQAGTATGVLGWAMILWLALARATGQAVYRDAARKAADWVELTQGATHGFRGGTLGFEPAPAPIAWVSTEHNVDLASALAELGHQDSADHARRFVASMWAPGERRFYNGLKPDGRVNTGSALDANLWPALLRGWDPHQFGLDWVLAHHAVPAAAPQGVDFNTDLDGIWLEGTGFTLLALKQAHRTTLAGNFLATLVANTSAGGMIYASTVPRLTTGLSGGINPDLADFFYYRRPHLAPTAWAAIASANLNPFQ